MIRKRAMGDVLWIEPVIRQLLEKYNLIVYTKFPELFANYPFNGVRFKRDLSLVEKVKWRLGRVFGMSRKFIDLEFAYEQNPKLHMLHAYQKVAGTHSTRDYPVIYSEGSKPSGFEFENYVVIHLETLSGRNFRNVYGVEWKDVSLYLKQKGFSVLQIGVAPQVIQGANYVKSSIPEMIYIIKNAKLFLGIDSGPSQIAATVGVPSILFFGAVNPEYRHFKEKFNGVFMQSFCEFQHCYHEQISANGITCRLVGDQGIPKCSVHSTEGVINNIKKLLKID